MSEREASGGRESPIRTRHSPPFMTAPPSEYELWAEGVIDKMQEEIVQAGIDRRALEEKLDRQTKIAEGLKAQLDERRTKTVEVFGIGTEVRLGGSDNLIGTVRKIEITQGGPFYLISWWEGFKRQEQWCYPSELVRHGDDLPLPETIYGVRE